ncbi:MAG: exodeoxyribonuclease VII large subunit [Cellvibrionaceae bacterium]
MAAMINTPEKTIFSVSQLNRRSKQLLETHLPLIWVSGELSNLAQPGSGHWYFSLKDDRAQVRCAMFKNANQRLRWNPASGQQVLVRARVSLYEGRGDYQLIVEHMEEAGAGALQQAYEALKLKLEQEGLFSEDRKQELPLFPAHIGIITSPTGAAIRDILSVMARRYPIAPITVIPVAVQGETAAAEMVTALNKAETFGEFDLLIIGRGGGSIEDLWAFNNEALARAIVDCPIPIVSAVGHEVDFTICDFVADVRAATPSASAEITTPDLEEWEQLLDSWQLQLSKQQQLIIEQKRQQLLHLRNRLRHPGERIKGQQLQLKQAQNTLIRTINYTLAMQKQALQQQQARCQQQHPQHNIKRLQEKLREYQRRGQQAANRLIKQKQQQFSTAAQLLNAVSPLQILGRGYGIVTRDDGSVVHSSDDIKTGDIVSTQLGQGRFNSTVIDTQKE